METYKQKSVTRTQRIDIAAIVVAVIGGTAIVSCKPASTPAPNPKAPASNASNTSGSGVGSSCVQLTGAESWAVPLDPKQTILAVSWNEVVGTSGQSVCASVCSSGWAAATLQDIRADEKKVESALQSTTRLKTLANDEFWTATVVENDPEGKAYTWYIGIGTETQSWPKNYERMALCKKRQDTTSSGNTDAGAPSTTNSNGSAVFWTESDGSLGCLGDTKDPTFGERNLEYYRNIANEGRSNFGTGARFQLRSLGVFTGASALGA